MTTPLITSLAILKVNFDRGGQDYVGNFLPLAGEILRQSSDDVVSIAQVQEGFQDEFGLDIPQGPIRTILKRAVSAGYAHPYANGTYRRDPQLLASLNFSPIRDAALREQQTLVGRLIAFARTESRALSLGDAEALLAAYVQQRGPALLASLSRSTSTVPSGPPAGPDQELINRFVANILRQDPQGVASLETFVKGSILFGAIFLPDLGGVTRRFQGLDVFIDTRILLRALGLAGPIQEKPARELLDLTYELGGSLYCFDHTLSEITRVLTAVENALRYQRRMREHSSEILEHLARQGSRPSDVALIIHRLPAMLRALRIAIKERPPQSPSLAVDEAALSGELRSATNRAYSDDAVGHDVDALTAIHRLRRGESKVVLEAAGAVLVTTNRLVKQVGNRFFNGDSSGNVPLVFDEEEFATIAWLKKPTAAPSLPTSLAIANSFAASSPPPEVWHEYLDEIDRLETAGDISEGEYYALRFSTTALESLRRQGRSKRETVTTASVLEILERVRDQIRLEVRPDIERQLAGTAEAVTRGRVAKADTDAETAEAGLRRLGESIASERARRRERIREFSSTAARRTVYMIRLPLAIAILAFGYVSLEPTIRPIVPLSVQLELPGWTRVAAAIAALALVLFTSRAAVSGTTLNSMLRGLEVSIASRMERWLIARFE